MLNADLHGMVSPGKAHACRTDWCCTAPFSGTVNHHVARGMRNTAPHAEQNPCGRTERGARSKCPPGGGTDVRLNRYAFDTHCYQYAEQTNKYTLAVKHNLMLKKYQKSLQRKHMALTAIDRAEADDASNERPAP